MKKIGMTLGEKEEVHLIFLMLEYLICKDLKFQNCARYHKLILGFNNNL